MGTMMDFEEYLSTIPFASNRNGAYGLYRKNLTGSGTEERILTASSEPFATDWTRDRAFVIYELDGNVWALPMSGPDRSPRAIATSPFFRIWRIDVV
jgi:hypothetical protein